MASVSDFNKLSMNFTVIDNGSQPGVVDDGDTFIAKEVIKETDQKAGAPLPLSDPISQFVTDMIYRRMDRYIESKRLGKDRRTDEVMALTDVEMFKRFCDYSYYECQVVQLDGNSNGKIEDNELVLKEDTAKVAYKKGDQVLANDKSVTIERNLVEAYMTRFSEVREMAAGLGVELKIPSYDSHFVIYDFSSSEERFEVWKNGKLLGIISNPSPSTYFSSEDLIKEIRRLTGG